MRISSLGVNIGACSLKLTASSLESLKNLLSGNSSIVDYTEATLSPFASTDLSGLSNPWTAKTAGTDPGVSSTLGITASGGSENIQYTYSGGNRTVIFSATLDSSDTTQFIAMNGGTITLRAQNGSLSLLSTMSGTVSVDDVVLSPQDRDALFDAACVDTEVVVQQTGASQSTGSLFFGRSGGGGFNGSIRRCVVIDETSVTGDDLISARSFARAWVKES